MTLPYGWLAFGLVLGAWLGLRAWLDARSRPIATGATRALDAQHVTPRRGP